MPLLSIIIPVYNTKKYLERCLISVMTQDFKDWECILVNDGSTDGSLEILEKYVSLDSRFRLINKKNTGVSDSRNAGIDAALGQWISLIDSDDMIMPNRYSYIFNTISNHPDISVFSCGCAVIYECDTNRKSNWTYPTGEYNIGDKIWFDSRHDNVSVFLYVYSTKLINDYNIRFVDCDYGEDVLFNYEAYVRAGKVYNENKPLYFYIVKQSESLSTSNLSAERHIRFLNAIKSTFDRLSKDENWNYFKDIAHSIYKRDHWKNLRKNNIDFVLPYVDNSDPQWIEQYNKYCGTYTIIPDVNDDRRYRSNDLLKYIFRGIDRYAPFIHTVHLLVSSRSQVPSWIDTTRVHIVEHSEFIPVEYLPTFNSSTIEMFLENIPGLSEKFLYGNDDMFITAPISEGDFFLDNKIKMKLNWMKIKSDNPLNWEYIFCNSWYVAAYGDYRPVVKESLALIPQHGISPMIKSLVRECYNEYKELILNSCSRIRENKNLNQYMFLIYAFIKKRLINTNISFKYFNHTSKNQDIIDTIIQKSIKTICINDSGEVDRDYTDIKSVFKKTLPYKSKFEK